MWKAVVGTFNQEKVLPSRGLLCDCEIFAYLRIAYNSSSNTEKPPVELYAWLLLHVGGTGGVGAGGQRGRGVEARGQAQRAPPHVRDHAHSRAARCTRVLLSNRHASNVWWCSIMLHYIWRRTPLAPSPMMKDPTSTLTLSEFIKTPFNEYLWR